jgi:hypothetical protein
MSTLSDLEVFLKEFGVSKSKEANLLCFEGHPYPGKFKIDNYKEFISQVADGLAYLWSEQYPPKLSASAPYYFVEQWGSDEQHRKLVFDCDIPDKDLTADDLLVFYKRVMELVKPFNYDCTDVTFVVKQAEGKQTKDGYRYSYHLVFPVIGASHSTMKSLAKKLIGEFPHFGIDLSIYTAKRGVRMIGSGKEKINRRDFLIKYYMRSDTEDDLTEPAMEDLTDADWLRELLEASSIQLPTNWKYIGDGEEEEPEPIKVSKKRSAPEPKAPTDPGKWQKEKAILEKQLNCTVSKIDDSLDQGVRFSLETNYCLIIGGVHTRPDSRCVTLGPTAQTYTCLNAKCAEEKKKLNIFTPQHLRNMFPDFKKAKKVTADYSPYQKVLIYCCEEIRNLQLLKHGTGLMRPIYIDKKHTGAYQPYLTVKEFVDQITSHETNEMMWRCKTKNQGTASNLVKEIIGDTTIQSYQDNRNCWSYRNGQLDCDVLPGQKPVWNPLSEYIPTKISTKFFDIDFDVKCLDALSPFDIATPVIDGLFSVHGMPQDVVDFEHVISGKMKYKIGQYEDYQTAPWYRGPGGGGKSKIALVFTCPYQDIDVGSISAATEKTFGLGVHAKKKIVICPDVGDKFGLDENLMFSVISGSDTMDLGMKYSGPLHVSRWEVPIAFFSNNVFNLKNVGGSASRRFLAHNLDGSIVENNMDLNTDIVNEVASRGIYKSCWAFLNFVHTHRSDNEKEFFW